MPRITWGLTCHMPVRSRDHPRLCADYPGADVGDLLGGVECSCHPHANFRCHSHKKSTRDRKTVEVAAADLPHSGGARWSFLSKTLYGSYSLMFMSGSCLPSLPATGPAYPEPNIPNFFIARLPDHYRRTPSPPVLNCLQSQLGR